MVRQVVSTWFAALLWGVLSLSADAQSETSPVQSQSAPRVTFAPMTQDEVDRFRDSLKTSRPLEPIPPRASQKVAESVRGIWSGTKTSVSTQIGEVVLRFRPSTEEVLSRSVTTENEASALQDSVDLRLSYADPAVTFVHSHPQDGSQVGGFRAKVRNQRNPTRVQLIHGQRDSSMYVAFPPYRSPADLWGFYVCPRVVRYQNVGRTGTRVLRLDRSPYDLSEVFVSASATGEANFEASRGKVRAAITLQVTSDLPESLGAVDESISSIAEPRVTYRPKYPFDFVRFTPRSDLQQGINMVVEFQNRVGQIRRENFSHVASVHKSSEPSPVSVTVNGARPVSDTGDCYFVQVQRYSWQEFDQSPPSF